MTWLQSFYSSHPEYRRVPIAKRTRNSIHFEIEPGRYEAHIQARPIFERGKRGLWIPASKITDSIKLAARLIRSPRQAAEWALMFPFAVSTYDSQPDGASGKDTWIIGTSANNNYGINTLLMAGASGSVALPYRSMLQFDVTSIPAGSTITIGTLTLRSTAEASTTDYFVYAHRGLSQWYEGAKDGAVPNVGQDGSTWSYRNYNGSVVWVGGAGGGSGSDYFAASTDGVNITAINAFYNWTVTADIQLWIDGTANYGWWLLGNEANINRWKQFASSDNGTASYRPELYSEYTVPPGGGGLFNPSFSSAFRGLFG